MITYQQKQDEFFKRVEREFSNGRKMSKEYGLKKDYINDNRISLGGLVFLPKDLQEKVIDKVINPLREADASQYYYLPKSLHLTIQNVKVVNHPPRFNEQDIEKVKEVFSKIIPKYKRFKFELRGLVTLPTSIYIKGYCGKVLEDLVLELRQGLKDVGVPDDKKYPHTDVFIGTVTICRYHQQPNDKLNETIEKLKNINLGELEINKIALSITNFVARPEKLKIIKKFRLK